ncbi:hypothetical protein F53441_14476 [Fusarium austroafricanum]|uniref:NADP-dependent oxidoreductase domain-containing protein n=1 Tax=Fusarium austroafricanum TaxID=2364996 RepID=A0A8H4JDE0_9HYPO|nr:hypothetical protein F53441_14476 [Fusarium austroafricanum]
MTTVQSTLDFLADLDIYKTQRPFVFTPGQEFERLIDTREEKLNTIHLSNEQVTLYDIRGKDGFSLQESGFEVVPNETRNSSLDFMPEAARDDYARETEEFWMKHLGAEYAFCYNVKVGPGGCLHVYSLANEWVLQLRRNGYWDPDEPVDLVSRGWLEPPARGIHDLTFEQAPILISKHLVAQEKEEYLRPEYRFRIVNTWRPLNPVVEDNPLAVCDARSVAPSDLVLADRIFPNDYYTLYFVKHSPKQRWHWVSKQTPAELTLMLMYDSKPCGARFCAHGSFKNPLAPPNATPRRSIETRSLVVTKVPGATSEVCSRGQLTGVGYTTGDTSASQLLCILVTVDREVTSHVTPGGGEEALFLKVLASMLRPPRESRFQGACRTIGVPYKAEIIFGGARMSPQRGFGDEAAVRDALAVLESYGINTIDTARVYGHSEAILGRSRASSRFLIDTKIPGGVEPGSLSAQHIKESLEESLQELQADNVRLTASPNYLD